jgi:hypothetical protein
LLNWPYISEINIRLVFTKTVPSEIYKYDYRFRNVRDRVGKEGAPDDRAALTQLVECLAVNQNVVGSSPASGVRYFNFL